MNASRDQLLSLMQSLGKYDSHPGLLLQRYLHESATGDQGKPEHKRQILDAAINSAKNDDLLGLYKAAFTRWSASLPNEPGPIDLATHGRVIVGLGSENILETGIRLHHTYGMPILPGSALKGLAAHYCDQVWGPTDKRFKRPTGPEDEAYRKFLAGKGPKPEDNFHRLLFGTTDDSGCITFHDAWLTPDSSEPLKLDVMTPHHPKWMDGSAAPTDFDSPIPVPFLSVSGKFRVAVSWQGPAGDKAKQWTELALSLLSDALKEWGIGGKTTSGYGRLVDPQDVSMPKQSLSGIAVSSPSMAARGGGVKVQFLGRHDKLKDAYWVQEQGRKRGLLKYGKCPEKMPSENQEIEVYRTNADRSSPEYRWDPPPATTPQGRPGGQQRRGRR